MAGVKKGSAGLMVAAFILITVLTSAQARKPVATIVPPARFVTSSNTTTTNTPTSNTTTVATTPTTTTIAPTTTTIAPAPTTSAPTPNTTTPAQNTTTTAVPANTTTVTSNTTTAAPTTQNTTTANVTIVPTTTPKPEPTPPANLTMGNYTVKKGNDLCVMVQAAIQIRVNNSKADGTFIVQPKAVTFTGNCDTNVADITLGFPEGMIDLSFVKNDTTKMVYVNSVAVGLNYSFKAGDMFPITKKNDSLQLFSTADGHSYSCKSESVFLGDGVFLEFSKQRSQAFDLVKNQFGQIDMCPADQPDYSVAIAVGVVLIILIIIVVIAYLISRRKRTDGYQSL